jgi:hypothetical protein
LIFAVIEHFRDIVDRAGGGNYQTLINAALREHIKGARLEAVVRRAVRKEVEAVREAFAKTGSAASRASRELSTATSSLKDRESYASGIAAPIHLALHKKFAARSTASALYPVVRK